MVRLGSLVHDNITGFKGIATERVTYLYGCVHINVVPTKIDPATGKPRLSENFDEQRMVVDGATDHSDNYVNQDLQSKFPLGSKARDTLTGFEGMLTAHLETLFSGQMIGITPVKLVAGAVADAVWFDVARVEVIKPDKPKVSKDNSAGSGSMTKFKSPTQARSMTRPTGRR